MDDRHLTGVILIYIVVGTFYMVVRDGLRPAKPAFNSYLYYQLSTLSVFIWPLFLAVDLWRLVCRLWQGAR